MDGFLKLQENIFGDLLYVLARQIGSMRIDSALETVKVIDKWLESDITLGGVEFRRLEKLYDVLWNQVFCFYNRNLYQKVIRWEYKGVNYVAVQ